MKYFGLTNEYGKIRDVGISKAFDMLNQRTAFTPEEMAQIFQQTTAAPRRILATEREDALLRAAQGFASRGRMFGGSLTGASADIEEEYGTRLSDLMSGVSGQLGLENIRLGSQRQLASMQQLFNILNTIIGSQGEDGDGFGDFLGKAFGTVAGALIGGPAGGAAGYTLGSNV